MSPIIKTELQQQFEKDGCVYHVHVASDKRTYDVAYWNGFLFGIGLAFCIAVTVSVFRGI